MFLMVFLLATQLSQPTTSDIYKALFIIHDDTFLPVQQNEKLQTILRQGPKLDFFQTAALGSTEDLERQLRADPSLISARTPFGWTALQMAAFSGNVANAKLLLDRGADIRVRAKSKFRNTPLLISMLSGQFEMARLLLDRGADVLDRQAEGFSAMHEAALLGRTDIIQLLLDHGAEINSRSDDGRTPLSEAIRGKHPEAVEMLKGKGAV